MTRKYLEAISGVYTGTDMPLVIINPEQSWGLAGSDHVSDDRTVWVTKTHWPMPRPGPVDDRDFTMDKAFIITRNVIDVIPSFFLLLFTGSHSMTCAEVFNEAFPE